MPHYVALTRPGDVRNATVAKNLGTVPVGLVSANDLEVGADGRNVPAFQVLTDKTLEGIAGIRPKDEGELLAVRGMGPGLYRKYREAILSVVRAHRS